MASLGLMSATRLIRISQIYIPPMRLMLHGLVRLGIGTARQGQTTQLHFKTQSIMPRTATIRWRTKPLDPLPLPSSNERQKTDRVAGCAARFEQDRDETRDEATAWPR